MPVKNCKVDGDPGYRWGDDGKCYSYPVGDEDARKKAKASAVRQGAAVEGPEVYGRLSEVDATGDEGEDYAALVTMAVGDVVWEPDRGLEHLKKLISDELNPRPPGPESAAPLTYTYWVCDVSPSAALVERGQEAWVVPYTMQEGKVLLAEGDDWIPAERGWIETAREYATLADADDLKTIDIDGVDILAAGGPYFGQGSPKKGDRYSVTKLRAIAKASNAVAAEVRAPVKLGHGDTQALLKRSGLSDDEMPAAGWLENFRVSKGKLLADMKAVPAKLASLMKAGRYRHRSVELGRVTSQVDGEKYEPVVLGVGLLGAKAPAVRTLDDIVALHNDDGIEPERVIEYVAEAEEEDAEVSVDTTTVKPKGTAKVKLTDEQVESIAEALSIEEADPAARRTAVMTKLEEAVEPEAPAEETPAEPVEPEAPAEEEPEAEASALSDAEIEVLKAKAENGERAFKALHEQRREVAIEAAMKAGKIDPSKVEKWRGYYDENEERTVELIGDLPVNEELLRVYGSDEPEGDGEDEAYRSFAEQTGITVRTGAGRE